MDRKTLKQYREKKARIVRLDKKIQENTYITQDVVLSGPPKHTKVIHGLYNGPKIRDLQAQREGCMEICRKIEKFIFAIDDDLTREIFVLRYLDGDTEPFLYQIAQTLGGRNTADSIRMIHDRYLKKDS